MGLIICFIYINIVWRKYNSSFFPKINMLQSYSILNPVFPNDQKFWSLKWKAIRHGLIFLIFALIIHNTENLIAENVLISLNLLYALNAVWLQIAREKHYRSEIRSGYSVKEFLLPILRACRLVTFYTIYLQILLYIIALLPDG